MEDKFGEAFTKLPPSKTAPGSGFMNNFERIKRGFGYQEEDYYTIAFLLKVEKSQYYEPDEDEVVIPQ